MGDVSVEVPESVFDAEITLLCGLDEKTCRFGYDIKPAASESYIE